jgi:hypothetical protein
LLPALGCSEPDIEEDFGGSTWESTHYRYRYQASDPLACPSVVQRLESYGEVLVSFLGVQRHRWTQSSYYKYPDQRTLERGGHCENSAQACADASRIIASVPLHGHEVVHSVMAKQTGMEVSRLLAEGLANALTCAPGFLPDEQDWVLDDFSPAPEREDVVQAGRLVLALLQEVGPQELMEMVGRIDDEASLAETRNRILLGWGIDIDQTLRAARDAGLSACVPIFACSGAALASGDTVLTAGCDGFDPATLPRTGPISLKVRGTPMRLMPCEMHDVSGALARISPYRAEGNWEYWLEPTSEHALWFDDAEYVTSVREARVTVSPAPGAFSGSCDLTSPRKLEPGQQVAVVLAGKPTSTHFALDLSLGSRLKLDWQKGPSPETFRVPERSVEVRWCRSCAAGKAADCQVLDRLHVEAQTITGENGVLVVNTDGALTRAAVLELTALYPE